MSSARFELFRTASFRIALFYAGLFSLSVFVLFVVIYWATTGFTAQQLAGRVERELAALQTEYRLGGRAGLLVELASRQVNPGAYYLLELPTGQVIGGNLPAQPMHIGWVDLPAQATGDHIRAKVVRLPDSSFLMVGLDSTRLDDLNLRVIQAFLWGSVATLILAIVGAILMSSVSLRRVDSIGRATEAIMAGDLDSRLPLTGGGDEFDRLAKQVNRMLDRIQALMRGVQQVSNDIAHDLKTPLTRLRHHLERARAEPDLHPDHDRAVQGAIAECDQALETFDALLRIAQIEAGSRREGFRPFDLASVLEMVATAYLPVIEESGRDLSLSLPSSATLSGDADLVTQMTANLIENALKYTPVGSHIALSLEQVGAQWRMRLDDDGPGIAEEHRTKVFQRFYRLDPSRSTPGSGLGLSLVLAIVQLHDAAIALTDNRPGLGVVIHFPIGALTRSNL